MSIFSAIFVFVNTGFLTMITVRESAANDTTSAKRKNISKIFHFACIVGLGSGLVVMIVVIVLREQLFDMLGLHVFAAAATTFFNIRAPFIPFEYLGNVLLSVLMGLMQMKQMLIASIVVNALYLPVLILMIHFMENTVAAIAWSSGFAIVVQIIAYGYIFVSKTFRSRYEIFDFSVYSRASQKTPLLEESFPEKETEKDETTIRDLGKASGLLFLKNFCSTASTVTSNIVLSAVLSENQFIASNVLSNTIQFTSFAAFFNTVINIFGPRCILTGDYARYKGLFIKAHVNNVLVATLSIALFFLIHTGNIALKKLTTPEDMGQVETILNPIWPLWFLNLLLSMNVNLYDTAMINFQKYKVLGILGVITNVFVAIPITLISGLKLHSLFGQYVGSAIAQGIELAVCAYLFHIKYLKIVKEKSENVKQLTATTPQIAADASFNGHSAIVAQIN
eukprot:Phypoly_transcript_08027.p1 GENE.Phypoly_transcript_08027~~Phypoly_transcript_08027.p1  ORF type:complete len:471 (+),score=66.24 Phypoly_transcript_08027:61-1413(+)